MTFSGPGVEESRPSELLGPLTVVNGRIKLDSLPTIPSGPGIPEYDSICIYRTLATNADQYYLVSTVSPTDHYIDSRRDADISAPSPWMRMFQNARAWLK